MASPLQDARDALIDAIRENAEAAKPQPGVMTAAGIREHAEAAKSLAEALQQLSRLTA